MRAAGTQNQQNMRLAQLWWARTPIVSRLRIMRKARHELAGIAPELVSTMTLSLMRTRVESQIAEILPLLGACSFLERNARRILRPRRLRRKALPFWLGGVESVVERVPFGIVLIIAPSNYPLFLAGVQTLQALVVGNAVIWKPGRGGGRVATLFAGALKRAGLPSGLLLVTDESPEAGVAAMQAGPDKIFFTGSAVVGRKILKDAAETTIPVVPELSGCDAVFVLPSADINLVVDAITFGMRLNGSATCMAPRRLILVGGVPKKLISLLCERLAGVDGISLADPVRRHLIDLLQDAENKGATIKGDTLAVLLKPLIVLNGRPEMKIAQADIFAPVLTVIETADIDAAIRADVLCPYGLTASVFGDEQPARALGAQLTVGTVLINDLIVSTADPRVSFGGRRGSGFGVTRGAEGLLEMTAAKTTTIRRGNGRRQYQPTGETHEAFFDGIIAMGHSMVLRKRFEGLWKMMRAARELTSSQDRH